MRTSQTYRKQTVAGNNSYVLYMASTYVSYVSVCKMYKYVIGESKDVSDRPPSTPGGGSLILCISIARYVHTVRNWVHGSSRDRKKERKKKNKKKYP